MEKDTTRYALLSVENLNPFVPSQDAILYLVTLVSAVTTEYWNGQLVPVWIEAYSEGVVENVSSGWN